jgi:CheY-like chemotaxis protein
MGWVLVLEDNEAIRDAMRLAIEFQGHKAYMASNGLEGLDILENRPKPCLILLDLMMPVMNGWEFSERIGEKEHFSAIPVVVVTAYAERLGKVRASEVIKKPFDLQTLLRIIQQYCPPPSGSA